MKKIPVLICFLLLISGVNSIAQEKSFQWLSRSTFYRPFISEIRSPINKIEIGFLNDLGPYYYVDGVENRPFLEAQLGIDIPVVLYTNRSKKSHKPWGISLSLPASAKCLVDMIERETAPLVNCDFWLGVELKGIWYPNINSKFGLKNLAFKFIPIAHESTHIGDEVAIHGYQTIEDFKRINVSYESWELGLTLNDPDTLKSNILSFRTGIMGVWWLYHGYYSVDSLEVKGQDVRKSGSKPEYYFILNWKRTQGWACSQKWQNVLSIELRNRPKFEYTVGVDEVRKWNLNSYIGWQYKKSDCYMGTMGLFFRFYYGINPHGQFRNLDNFRFIGLSLVVR